MWSKDKMCEVRVGTNNFPGWALEFYFTDQLIFCQKTNTAEGLKPFYTILLDCQEAMKLNRFQILTTKEKFTNYIPTASPLHYNIK